MLTRKLCAVACSVLLLSACSPEQKQTISVSGSSTIAPLMADIGKRFEALNPDIHVDVQSGGTSRGIQDVRNGLASIGMASRALTDAEKDLTDHVDRKLSTPLMWSSSKCERTNRSIGSSRPQLDAVNRNW